MGQRDGSAINGSQAFSTSAPEDLILLAAVAIHDKHTIKNNKILS